MNTGVSVALVTVLSVAVAACGVAEPGTDPDTESLLEVRLASLDSVRGFHSVMFEGEVLYLAPEPVLSDADWLSVQPVVRENAVILSVQCTDEAANRMRIVTQEHIDKPVATLWRSEVRTVAIVRNAVSCSPATIALPFKEGEAETIAETVRQRWPAENE
jgi:preprotein translocase subunit SecD